MMKAWLNDTWGSVGPGIWQGKEMMIVTTAAIFTDTPPMEIGAVLKISSEITRGFGPMAGMACARFSSSRLMAIAVMSADMLVPLRRTGR